MRSPSPRARESWPSCTFFWVIFGVQTRKARGPCQSRKSETPEAETRTAWFCGPLFQISDFGVLSDFGLPPSAVLGPRPHSAPHSLLDSEAFLHSLLLRRTGRISDLSCPCLFVFI